MCCFLYVWFSMFYSNIAAALSELNHKIHWRLIVLISAFSSWTFYFGVINIYICKAQTWYVKKSRPLIWPESVILKLNVFFIFIRERWHLLQMRQNCWNSRRIIKFCRIQSVGWLVNGYFMGYQCVSHCIVWHQHHNLVCLYKRIKSVPGCHTTGSMCVSVRAPFIESNMCDCVMCFECHYKVVSQPITSQKGRDLSCCTTVFFWHQRLWLTGLCVSTEDKPGEIGIIVALAMLILGTFQWAVITSITVDGLVRSNTTTLITLVSRSVFIFQHQQTASGLPMLSLNLLTSLDSDSLFNLIEVDIEKHPSVSRSELLQWISHLLIQLLEFGALMSWTATLNCFPIWSI